MSAEFLDRKVRTFFRRFDGNQDGFLTRQDFEDMAERSCEFENPDSARRKTAKDLYTAFFDMFYAYGGNDEKMDENDFAKAVKLIRLDPKFRILMRDLSYITFNLVDLDGNGYIDVEELTRLFRYLQLTEAEMAAKTSFKNIDYDDDGKITFEEYKKAVLDFWFTDDEESRGVTFYGPLI